MPMPLLTRRGFTASSIAVFALALGHPGAHAADPRLPKLGKPHPFTFDDLVDRARALAVRPYEPPQVIAPEILDRIDYEAHWQIRFRDEATLMPPGTDAPVQFFHPGRFFREPVRIHLRDDGVAREVLFTEDYFVIPADSPAHHLPPGVGWAGFRVMRPDLEPDWVSFLGASYFRADGPFMQYGLSARGLAIDTGLSRPEEFPRFSAFWLGAPENPGDQLGVWALLESASVVGAYRFGLSGGSLKQPSLVTVHARLFFRNAVERLGVAPLTSMYWYSQQNRIVADDWRPEVHDSDGLAIATGSGERIWRPLMNPHIVRTSSYMDSDPKGFGLIQRDRRFENYEDDGALYHRRPSLWVEPLGKWGRGAVQVVEIPTKDETFDNIVAYWTPEAQPRAGDTLGLDYRLHWADRDPLPASVATVWSTWQGQGGRPGQPIPEGIDKMVIDFKGPALDGLNAESGVEPVVEARNGRIAGPVDTWPVGGADRWRLSFDFTSDPDARDPVELRAWLRRNGEAITETWLGQATTDRRGTSERG
jgi:periplasmic glucans biosynthesis protein